MTTADCCLNLAIIGSRGFPSTYGGYETLVRYVARDWVHRGHRVSVYTRWRNGSNRVWLDDGVRCIWTPGLDTHIHSTLSFGMTASVDAAIRGYDAALVLNVANGFYLPLLRARGIPTVVNTDGIEWERRKWGKAAKRTFRTGAAMAARYADVLVADSLAIADVWRDLWGVESTFVPYGAPVIDVADPDRVKPLGLSARRYVLVVARLIPENNVELILDAVELLPDQPQTVVVGAATTQSALEARLRTANHAGALRWLGHVDDQALLTQLWANAGAYIHGHSVGGTNPGLLQALGAGAPTLALDTQFNREVVRSQRQMFQLNAEQLALQIEALLKDGAKQEEFADHGRSIVRQHYAWPDVSTRYLAALTEARSRMQTGKGRRRAATLPRLDGGSNDRRLR